MKRNFFAGYLLFILSIGVSAVSGQVTLSGPTCVVPGVTYQYSISGNWDSVSTMQVCITGGVMMDSTNTCSPSGGAPLAQILVIWNDAGTGSLTVTSTAGQNTLSISVTNPLQPGNIDSSVKVQMIAQDSIPATITCGADSGGSCSPVYSEQWQQSPDIVNWTDITGANSHNLVISTSLVQSTYYRRKVVETSSGTIGYSDVAVVFVGFTSGATDTSGTGSTDSTTTQHDTTGTGFIRYIEPTSRKSFQIYALQKQMLMQKNKMWMIKHELLCFEQA